MHTLGLEINTLGLKIHSLGFKTHSLGLVWNDQSEDSISIRCIYYTLFSTQPLYQATIFTFGPLI